MTTVKKNYSNSIFLEKSKEKNIFSSEKFLLSKLKAKKFGCSVGPKKRGFSILRVFVRLTKAYFLVLYAILSKRFIGYALLYVLHLTKLS